jgi:hypothetical protein
MAILAQDAGARVFGLAQAATGNEVIASILGSLAAGVECEKEGNMPVGQSDVGQKIDSIERIARYE